MILRAVRCVEGAPALGTRWRRLRSLLLWSAVVLPGAVAVGCLVLGVLAEDGGRWRALPCAVSTAIAVLQVGWLCRRGLSRPTSWPPVAASAAVGQVLFGAIPGYGLAERAASPAVAGALFAGCLAGAVGSCVSARRARRTLLDPPVPELGATGFRLDYALRIAPRRNQRVTARMEIGGDLVQWWAQSHRGRKLGPRVHFSVWSAHLREVRAITLPPEPVERRWVVFEDGSVLHTRPGPALLLRTGDGDWVVPMDDAVVIGEILLSRKKFSARRR